ncbi:MAG: N-acetylmuramic acid 6-phosphate etherase [Vampirovibrionales bacterium]|nr:N-acetylmuramic acid 6-phosphate etherase [Vampirovibrionales bacterium]
MTDVSLLSSERYHRLARLQAAMALPTEQINPLTAFVDVGSVGESVAQLYAAQQVGYTAVAKALPAISQLLEAMLPRFEAGGRLIYVGAGTSGRLGVLDASEISPTFGMPAGRVMGVIAGGEKALTTSVEGAEDDEEQAIENLTVLSLTPNDTVVGISASGNAPYVLAALRYAQQRGALTASVASNSGSKIEAVSDYPIVTPSGAEPIAGSSRMNAGTAQKLVLNLISTGLMVAMGRTYGNVMVALRPSNTKLETRAICMVSALANVEEPDAKNALQQTAPRPEDWHVRAAILMLTHHLGLTDAIELLATTQGRLAPLLDTPLIEGQ